jgi:hypothetical protein
MSTRIYFPAPGPETMRTGNIGGGGEHQVGCRPLFLEIARAIGAIGSSAAFVLFLDLVVGK